MAVWLHVHVQPTAASVMAQVAAARSAIAIGYVPGRCDRRIIKRYRLVIDRQSPNTPGKRHGQSGSGPGWHAGQIRQTACGANTVH